MDGVPPRSVLDRRVMKTNDFQGENSATLLDSFANVW
jgi:hypothetical protein